MNKLALMTGIDIPIVEIATSIHQPSIRDISFLGEEEYFRTLQYLCFNKEILIESNPEGKSRLESMNNFQIFMMLIGDKSQSDAPNHRQEVIQLFKLFFPNFDMQFLPTGLYFVNVKEKTNFVVNETNFDIIKQTIQDISDISSSSNGSNQTYNPKGKKAAEIAAKLMAGRAKAAKQKGDKQTGILARYVSTLTVGLHSMSLDQCLGLTIYQLYDLIQRYGLYTAWDIDIRSRLAGGNSDDKPDDWMKNIH